MTETSLPELSEDDAALLDELSPVSERKLRTILCVGQTTLTQIRQRKMGPPWTTNGVHIYYDLYDVLVWCLNRRVTKQTKMPRTTEEFMDKVRAWDGSRPTKPEPTPPSEEDAAYLDSLGWVAEKRAAKMLGLIDTSLKSARRRGNAPRLREENGRFEYRMRDVLDWCLARAGQNSAKTPRTTEEFMETIQANMNRANGKPEVDARLGELEKTPKNGVAKAPGLPDLYKIGTTGRPWVNPSTGRRYSTYYVWVSAYAPFEMCDSVTTSRALMSA